MSFPLHRHNERVFADDFAGEVFVCDIDRTYLATRFSTLKGLARIPVEFAIDKTAIEGMVALLKEVRRGPGPKSRQTPLYFISASPRQLRRVIERKMLIDGLEFDGTIFKDWTKVLLSLRPGRLREQLGFKMTALIAQRQDLPRGAREVLVGDDLESDTLAFVLYADYLAGRLTEPEVLATLRAHGVFHSDVEGVRRLRRLLQPSAGVERVYIRLERYAEAPDAFLDYAPGVVACRGALQIALALWHAGRIGARGVARVARELAAAGSSGEELRELFTDAVRRALVPPARARELVSAGVLEGPSEPPEPDPLWAEAMGRPLDAPWTPARVRASV